MTLLIASVFASTVEELEALAASAWRAGADAVEARIDNFRDALNQLNGLIRRHGDRKWLITCRSQSEGGLFVGNGIEAGLRALEAVEGTNAWIDVELAAWRSDRELRTRVQLHLGAHSPAMLVLSAHFFEGATANLTSLVDETLREGPLVVAKVAYAGTHINDSFHALDLMHRYGPRVVAICMGEAGTWTRILAKKLGAFATFASLDQTASTAPGQASVEELRENFGWDRIDAGAKVFGVAGDPIAHSLSPRLFNHWFKQHNCNAVFVPMPIGGDRGGLAQFFAECERRPWLHLSGMSITIPHKVEALTWAGDAADPMSRGIGAANTLVAQHDRNCESRAACPSPASSGTGMCPEPHGGAALGHATRRIDHVDIPVLGEVRPAAYNTDCYAAVDSLAAALGRPRNELAGLTVDVLGAGGAARAVCYGLAEMGCRVTAFARSHKSAQDFERWGVAVRDWTERLENSAEVLVNCTPVGMWPVVDESPMPAEALRSRRLVFDLIYRPLKTKLLWDAAGAGCQTLGGLDMFVRQAATQFALWTGQTPDATGACRMLEMVLECEAHRTTRKNCVALIGARGSGKTTVARLLAQILGVRHVDIDEMVIASSGRTIRQIFAEQREEGFRRLESDAVLLATGMKTPAVISMGGGAVMDLANISQVARVARIIWLKAPANVLAGRMAQDTKSAENRPNLTKHDALKEMDEVLRVREPLYRAAADFIMDTSQLGTAEVAQRIANWIGK